jgi:O-methyltransferase
MNITFSQEYISKGEIVHVIKTLVKRVANKLGFEILQIPKPRKDSESLAYAPVMPTATYSPWHADASFNEAYEAVLGFTLVDKYRCFELWKLVEQSAKLPSGAILEVGVWRGGTGALIAKQAKECGIPGQVYLCDTFVGVAKAGQKDSGYRGGEHSDTTLQVVEELVFQKMNLDNVRILEGVFPDQTSHEIKDSEFRFCHIDVDVYQSAKDTVNWIWDKMVRGGIIVFDDYGFVGCDGITKYVEEIMSYNDRIVLHNLNGHAVIVKL